MSTGSDPTDVDSAPHVAVSDLRSRFEKLAQDKDAVAPPTPSASRPSSTYGLLVPEVSRPRAQSHTDQQGGTSPTNGHHLRTSSSSSDLRPGQKKPPPPPPPSRGSRANNPSPSPSPRTGPSPNPTSTTPLPDILIPGNPASAGKPALLSRRPPPPPPPATPHSEHAPDTHSMPSSGGVASLINKFGSTIPPVPTSPPSLRPISIGQRLVPNTPPIAASLNSPILSPNTQDALRSPLAYPRNMTASPEKLQESSPPPDIHLQSPFDDEISGSEASVSHPPGPPPPLPSRPSSISSLLDPKGPQHKRRGSSSDSSDHSSIASSIGAHHASKSMPIPPRPPPRHSASLTPSTTPGSSGHNTPTTSAPPPLPRRRPTTALAASPDSDAGGMVASAPPASSLERKPVGSSKLPPPPTRTIGLGDKLPPPRRPPSPSSDEDDEDDEPKQKMMDSMPDTSRSSRRPPFIQVHKYPESRIHVPAHTGIVAVSGHTVVVAHTHHIKIYDLSLLDTPVYSLDLKEIGGEWKKQDLKVSSMEWRSTSVQENRGALLWLGTKEGHLLELDTHTGSLVATKQAAHTHAITHIFRQGSSMLTMDDNGKVLVFAPDAETKGDFHLALTQPRVVRIADKQEFAKMLGGRLWTSARIDPHNSGSAARGPIIKVYDLLFPGSAGRSVLTSEPVGNVTSGAVMPSQPNNVFLGHEGGYVSIWALDTHDGVPECVEVIKVSNSDILCLEGVGERLWTGGRKGMIAAYDVVPRPWIMTNNWMAHEGLPAYSLAVDPWSIEKVGKLSVTSIGRDERLHFWDGLLGENWIDQELLKREEEFSTFRDLSVLIVSWNVDASKPDALTGDVENVNFLDNVLSTVETPDIIAFGFQELIDLESRKMAAKTVLLGGKKKTGDGAISEKVTSSYKKWYDRLVLAVRLAMPPDTPYTVIHTENLVGLFSCIFVKNTERICLKDVAITTIKRGMGGRYGNKGGIVARFQIDDSSICFINSHLAAGHHHVRQRNADVAAILEDKEVFPAADGFHQESLAYVGGGDGSMILDHEIVFFSGDMNYRIDQRRDAVAAAVKEGDLQYLLIHDQLSKEMKFNRGFRLRTFTEGPLTFAPTYKYDPRTDEYDTSEKRRIPAWCDRVLWRSREPNRVQQLHYRRYEANISDHRPISAGFRMNVKSMDRDARAKAKVEVEELWTQHEYLLLTTARQYYLDQELI